MDLEDYSSESDEEEEGSDFVSSAEEEMEEGEEQANVPLIDLAGDNTSNQINPMPNKNQNVASLIASCSDAERIASSKIPTPVRTSPGTANSSASALEDDSFDLDLYGDLEMNVFQRSSPSERKTVSYSIIGALRLRIHGLYQFLYLEQRAN